MNGNRSSCSGSPAPAPRATASTSSTRSPRYSSPLDYGDQGQGAETRTQLAIKNLSGTLTAQQVTLAVQGLAGLSSGWYDFSIDDTVYTNTLNVGDLVPGASATFWLRQIIPATVNPLGLQSARIFPTPSAWV